MCWSRPGKKKQNKKDDFYVTRYLMSEFVQSVSIIFIEKM